MRGNGPAWPARARAPPRAVPASPRPMTRIPSSAPGDERRRRDRQEPLDVARHQHRLLDAGGDVGIEPARLLVRGDRLVEEPAVAAGVDEPGEQLRVVAVAVRLAQQPHDRARRLADVRLELRVELVRHRQARVELERAAERVLGARLAVGATLDVLADHAVAAAELRPRRREVGIQLQAALVEVARLRELGVGARQLVGAQVQLVARALVGRVRRGRGVGAAERQRQAPRPRAARCRPAGGTGRPGSDWTVCDVSSVPPGASTSCADARSWSPARSSVPMTTRSTSASAASAFRSGASPAKRAAVGARPHDQRADARQRRRDRVGQAEGQEVRLGIGTQDAEGQHHEAREGACQRGRVLARRRRPARAARPPSPRPRRGGPRDAWPAPGGSRGPRPRPRASP